MGEEKMKMMMVDEEKIVRVFEMVSPRLSQRDLVSLLFVSSWLKRALSSSPSLWQVINLREMRNAGERLIIGLSLSRYHHVKEISLEFAQDIEDSHLQLIKKKHSDSLWNLESLNLNGCQKIGDQGIEVISSACPNLKVFSIYWNVRVTDKGITHLVQNSRHIIDLNLSGCKGISDESMLRISEKYAHLESLNLTRCVKLTDAGLQQILVKCYTLRTLNLYALSSLTDDAYKKISLLTHLRFLDLCGAQNLSDEGLSHIAKCKNMVSLNLTWCVRITDQGVITIAHGCKNLEFLSLFGIVGVTDNCLEALSMSCSHSLTTLDVNGCIGIKTQIAPLVDCLTQLINSIQRRSRDELVQLFPKLTCFKVHS